MCQSKCLSMQRPVPCLHKHAWWAIFLRLSGSQGIFRNSLGSYWCGVNSAFGDPHFRVTSPGEDPICFDVDTESENILALFADGSSALEINAQFKASLTTLQSVACNFDKINFRMWIMVWNNSWKWLDSQVLTVFKLWWLTKVLKFTIKALSDLHSTSLLNPVSKNFKILMIHFNWYFY